jgi:photosystem II stability/assembly factor-like uncharacterized protein
MSYLKLLLILLLGGIIISCGTNSEPDEPTIMWRIMGLNESHVLSLSFSNDILFAGTENGAYKTEVDDDVNWIDLGLDTDTTKVSKIISWNMENILATVSYDTIREEDKVLFESMDGGNSWEGRSLELQNESNNYSYIYFLDYVSDNPNILFGCSGYVIRSNNAGQTWERIFVGGVSEFLYVSKEHPNQIWTGGWTNIFSPYLAKTEDGGETWTELNQEIYFNTDANVYAAVIHPENEETVLAGLGGAVGPANVIRKSEDGGETWSTVLEGYNTRVLKNSEIQPNRVYASGRSPQGQLFVAISEDYGDSWKVETYEESPGGIQTNDMIVTEVNGNEKIYFGTNKGVYSYRFEE